MRYSAAFERDWSFYTANPAAFSFSGSAPPPVAYAPDGPDAKRAFHAYDSRGKLPATREPDLLRAALVAKASVNLHVKLWAEGLADGTLWASDLAAIGAETGAPRWVFEAVWRQAARLHRQGRRGSAALPTALDLARALDALDRPPGGPLRAACQPAPPAPPADG